MTKRSESEKTNCPCQSTDTTDDRRVFFAALPDAGVIDDMMIAAREVLDQIPDTAEIRRAKLECDDPEMVRHAAMAGRLALDAISGRQGNVEPDDAFVAMMLVEQQSMILAALGDAAGPGNRSCIGKCRAERKTCDAGKHRCNFDAFLCRLNCFFKLDVGVNVG